MCVWLCLLQNTGKFDTPTVQLLCGGLLGVLIGNSGGIELLPIKLFSILEHAALITPSFRDRKSLTAALLETKEI